MNLYNHCFCFENPIPEWEEFKERVLSKTHFYMNQEVNLADFLEQDEMSEAGSGVNDLRERKFLYEPGNHRKEGIKVLYPKIPQKYLELLNSGKGSDEEIMLSCHDDLCWINDFTYDVLDKYNEFKPFMTIDEMDVEVKMEDIREAREVFEDFLDSDDCSHYDWERSLEEIYEGYNMVYDLLNEVERVYYLRN